jgi:hypothetical protein
MSRYTLQISIALLCLVLFMPISVVAQSSFEQALQEGRSFGNAQPSGKDATANMINGTLQNQGIPGLTPQTQSDAQAQGQFFLDNAGQLNAQGQGALSTTEGGLFLQNSYNLRPRTLIDEQNPLVILGQQAANGAQGCYSQKVCTQPTNEVVTHTRQVTCSLEYAETGAQCTYPLPPPRVDQGYGDGSLCTDHNLNARVHQENATTYHLQLLDTGPGGDYHRNCGGAGSGGGIGDWHTLKILSLPAPPTSFNFCVSASGPGCGSGTVCVSSPDQAATVTSCGAGGAQTPSYTFNYRFEMPPPPVDPATIQAACGAYMTPNCADLSENCTATDCTRSYVCIDPNQQVDGCATYRNQCTFQGQGCALRNSYGLCLTQQETYACTTQTTQPGCAKEEIQTICPGAPDGIRCMNPSDCADITSPPSGDLALATSHMESLGAAQNDHTTNPLVIFTGNNLACRTTLASGITRDCCSLDSTLLSCNSAEQLLQTRRTHGQCVEIGTYCSSRIDLGFTSICAERTTGFCCFSSKLVRIIQEQGRPQLGIGWGTAENPDCRGFTPEELQRINFQAIDFSEYYADIVAHPPDPQQLTNQAQASPALTPDSGNVPPPPDGVSEGQVQQDIQEFYGTHAP